MTTITMSVHTQEHIDQQTANISDDVTQVILTVTAPHKVHYAMKALEKLAPLGFKVDQIINTTTTTLTR
ncbi:hypothetical protein NB520_03585 [Vibrio antiquarius]|uniref:hypothetical protein n=1 Tax=Vibrio antiquarius (strain Ex25) TaxID=150340 RepID=UPI00265AFFE6|nr:hypothetical protein [Vibrio antiquarius]MCR9626924.1 hypothetical protein [Vibrio antiquarius]MCR9630573.1 hypothetical protein [Vibrio antiquarius]